MLADVKIKGNVSIRVFISFSLSCLCDIFSGYGFIWQRVRSLPYAPEYVRLRTFVPKEARPLLRRVQKGDFDMCGPHKILEKTRRLVENLEIATSLRSDHYTNYLNISGELPKDKKSCCGSWMTP